MAGLSLTFWPNPVYRNHRGEMRWYFNVAIREVNAQPVRVLRYRGEWYDMNGHLLESKEDMLDIPLRAHQHISYPDLWVTSAMPQFHYRLTVLGCNAHGQEVSAEGTLVCR